ncbi:single-stranded DNA-binding protein [Cryobacterium sp. PAMC25264]|uniref:single-stranded DNA-binding protein n=1 Tax=Cryobacterium sp. PAMC25264 TaxID=2861288 RepID=UPI001C634BE0|nr:single-stranded DNA-binding protein [Cryobacterium sp. PAMC25264]QYF75088.1 single-stranded DNA-binding protein [Cryobacterium sp. PAMC25264]
MTDTIALTGIVATTPRHLVTSSGLAITSFRLACRQRRFDRSKNSWVDADTNWYTVSSFRQLAQNVEQSVRKGEHVLVTGRLRIRDWENQDRSGTSVEVEADAVGHNLSWGTTSLVRSVPPASAEQPGAEQPGAEQPSGDQPGADRHDRDPYGAAQPSAGQPAAAWPATDMETRPA